MEKVLLLIYPTFSEFEITVAITVLSREFDMVTVAPRSGLVTGESGLQVMPHTTVQHVDVDEYQALIIPGAEDMIHIKDEEPVFAMVRDFAERGKVVGAICGGPYILLRAGVLDGKNYTVTFRKEQRTFLGFPEEGYVWEPVVESENLVTAQGHAFVEFGLRLAEKLGMHISPETRNFFHGRHSALRLE